LAALQVGFDASVQSASVRHATHALLTVLHFGVAASAAQLASDVHLTQRFVTVLHTGVAARVAH
jgi:hypothetical protein